MKYGCCFFVLKQKNLIFIYSFVCSRKKKIIKERKLSNKKLITTIEKQLILKTHLKIINN